MPAPRDEFLAGATAAAGDGDRRGFLRRALAGYYESRDSQKARYRDWELARDAAATAKWTAVNRLDRNLIRFEEAFTRNGGQVHWAGDAAEARAIIVGIIRAAGARSVVKSKCMTTEEIHLNDALEAEGFDVVESDLGEFIQQLRGEPPFHFVFPCMHLRREEISELFGRRLGAEATASPEELTMIARRHLRQKFLEADVGISGANFLVADTGQISITENEGNARLTCALPRTHIAVVGIEKVIERVEDLALLLPMLATAGAGQLMTGYNTLYSGPRRAGEVDGPEAFHIVLLDNRRTALLADPEQRDALQCIRCGACLNVCPIFKNIGGLSYRTTYQGPIGSVITPHLRGLRDWNHLSGASSLCGACTEVCPVRIDLHHHLLRNRRNAVRRHGGTLDRLFHRGLGWVIVRPRVFALGGRLFRHLLPALRHLPVPFLRAWLRTRELVGGAAPSFREQWKRGES